jgi:Ser/Thr protein kinase RdoA (MazF antagonist)
MSRDEAIQLIRNVVTAEIESTKAVNTGTGRVSQRLEKRERQAVAAVFAALIGEPPNDREIALMVNY